MNQRIKELAEQARPTYSNGKKVLGLNSEFHELWMEKFAELIVKECAEIASCNGHVSGLALGDLIKEHLGVEE